MCGNNAVLPGPGGITLLAVEYVWHVLFQMRAVQLLVQHREISCQPRHKEERYAKISTSVVKFSDL